MTHCIGQSGHPQCSNCARLRPAAIMRPVVRLTDCAMFDPSDRAVGARTSNGNKPPRANLIPFAGKEKR